MTKSSKLHHPVSVTFLLVVFPPLAWWIMYKNKKYHTWFPTMILFYTVPNLIIFLAGGFYFAALFYLTQILVSLILKREIANHQNHDLAILISVLFLSIDTIFPLIIYALRFLPKVLY